MVRVSKFDFDVGTKKVSLQIDFSRENVARCRAQKFSTGKKSVGENENQSWQESEVLVVKNALNC